MNEKNSKESILIVDDNADTVELIRRNLMFHSFVLHTVSSVVEAIHVLSTTQINCVITDIKMPSLSGHDLIAHIQQNYKNIGIIVITGFPSIDGAVQSIKGGAQEYIIKPFTDEELLGAVRRAFTTLNSRAKVGGTYRMLQSEPYGIIGSSKTMHRVIDTIAKTSTTTETVLIQGESGTGKELVARAIHYSSQRAAAPFVPINCGCIPENLIEAELFGYVKGAFTGSTESRAGFFQAAEGGTIFLDEISETTPSMQIKLLRVLQDKTVYMLGSRTSRQVDIRILAATNKNLFTLVKKGVFREDLYYRLNVITIDIPPLRERDDDILLLINFFNNRFCTELGKPVVRFSDAAVEVLKNYSWPGNVRELENVVKRLVLMNESDLIDVPDLPGLMRLNFLKPEAALQTLEVIEAEHIKAVMTQCAHNKSCAAKILGIDRKTLREKLKKLGYDINQE
ncbi:MAG: sigma-54-dependent Fis family transcriptional regulator [Chitinivibrionales bacterium]|nr:sigma-54-dependent Fis family transcriptional regulator [Chitinivibrionales bacterium]